MYKNKRFLALVPARGGSVGIPDKNICLLSGKPLVLWTIDGASKSKLLDAIYCTTNDEKIASVARQNPACKIIKRPDELATSTSKTIDCVVHALEELEKNGECYDYVLILQPTSPLRTTEQIDDLIKYMVEHDIPSCASVSHIHFLPVLLREAEISETGVVRLASLVGGNSTVRRQDAAPIYYVDGSMYCYKTSLFKNYGNEISINDAPYGFVIDENTAIDINQIEDLKVCETLMAMRKNK